MHIAYVQQNDPKDNMLFGDHCQRKESKNNKHTFIYMWNVYLRKVVFITYSVSLKVSSSFFVSLLWTGTTCISPISVAWPTTSSTTYKKILISLYINKKIDRFMRKTVKLPIRKLESRLPLMISWNVANDKKQSSFFREDSVTLELFMIDSLNPWLVGRYFPAVGVTEKFSMNLHCPTCSFLTRPRKTLLQVQWILTPYINIKKI